MIEPIGATFNDGFRMRLKKNVSSVRTRFTAAHEACHTFFYEHVPELKFGAHVTDDAEERLCNLGAAVLLIPARSLGRDAKSLPICLDSLGYLARRYDVSSSTMLLRLRGIGLWKCQLSRWHRTVSGQFVLDRIYGAKRAEWQWAEASLLDRAWKSKNSIFGTNFVFIEGTGGSRRYKPIAYNIQRSGNDLLSLWGSGVKPGSESHPLLDSGTPQK